MRTRWIGVAVLLLAACGGGGKKTVVEPEVVVEAPKPKPPPPPPPVCVIAGAEQSLIGMVEADANAVKFCVSDGAEQNQCYGVDIAAKKYAQLDEQPKGQSPVLDPDPARLETTAKEVKVCIGEDCKTVKPKVPKKSENPIDAVVNATGTYVAVLMGNAEKGKGTVEVWNVATGKKSGTVKYAKGAYKCGEARMLGNTVFVSASVCGGADARGYLYSLKGKKLADVGGKTFGTYGTVPLQVSDTTWAFLDENGSTIAIQDVATGKLAKTIDIGPLWAGDATAEAPLEGGEGEEPAEAAAPPAMGNAGESALVRGGEGKLIVVSGGPMPGGVGVVDVESGALETSIAALQCAMADDAATEPAADDEPADDDAADE
jgi:hypothetical protein